MFSAGICCPVLPLECITRLVSRQAGPPGGGLRLLWTQSQGRRQILAIAGRRTWQFYAAGARRSALDFADSSGRPTVQEAQQERQEPRGVHLV